MPYTYPNVPVQIKKLPVGAQKLWVRVFNAVHNDTGNEDRARIAAWSAVKEKYKKVGDEWHKKYLDKLAMDISKSINDLENTFFDLMMLREEKFEMELIKVMEQAKAEMLKKFDEDFKLTKSDNEFFSNQKDFINISKFNRVNEYVFEEILFNKNINEYFSKAKNNINVIALINPDPFNDVIWQNIFDSYQAGGQTIATIFDLPINFSMRDKRVRNKMKNSSLKLAKEISKHITSQIKNQLLIGIRSGESIPELKKRILNAWNKPITVNVPAKFKDGDLIRRGYSYELSAKDWATTVARTETAKSFYGGKLEGYRQSGVVNAVSYQTAEDERTCPICEKLNGQVFKLENANDLVPQHANCRCTVIPILDESFNESAQTAAENISDLYTTTKVIGVDD